MQDDTNITTIFERFTRGECSREELVIFYNLIGQQDDASLKILLDNYFKQERSAKNTEKVDWEYMFHQIVGSNHLADTIPAPHKVHFLRTAWFRYAAVLLLVVGIGTFFYKFYKPKQEHVAYTAPIGLPVEISPGGNRAVLILADGSKITLDSADNGNIASQGATRILKLKDGSLSYHGSAQLAAGNDLLYNTIATPKGGQYTIVLPDGSKVWLNAESSIRFPAAFTGNERSVEVTGECYIEVAIDKTKPFLANAMGTTIRVLGTGFNVNAYPNEPGVKTTLENGAIQVNNALLKPGQAYFNGTVTYANLEKDLAWKNGLFNFEGSTLQEAMRQLERWYDIEVVYENGVKEIEVMGKITKGVSLNGLLLGFKELGVHYRLDGRKLTIMP